MLKFPFKHKVECMSKNNYPLALHERQQIEYYLRLKFKKRGVGRRIGRGHSVVVREISRNANSDGVYRASFAQAKAERTARKTNKRKLDKNEFLLRHIEEQLENGLSPEQISGRLKEQPPKFLLEQTVSHESIYQYIYNTAYGKRLYQYLRRAKPKRQKRYSRKKQTKNPISGRVSIHQRPEDITLKTRYGDWERYLMEFKKQRTCLSVQYERKSMLIRLSKVANKTAEESLRALMTAIDTLPLTLFKSITFDNGGENVCHIELKKTFEVETYFCDPYASWQKGGVENANGLIRQYLPKNANLSKINNKDIEEIREKLNNRPRKSLNYLTPNEIINREFNLRSGALNS